MIVMMVEAENPQTKIEGGGREDAVCEIPLEGMKGVNSPKNFCVVQKEFWEVKGHGIWD